ncbi:MAG: hypothetical protein KBS83_01515 [Lachnospiraceae bacterium]|nr:hypothetical protein [Candidatus Equihabitans merdae]
MTKYELFCMIFLTFDADWSETHNEELREYLSDANPFLFQGECSADPAVYTTFCKFIGETKITEATSYELAQKYVDSLNNTALSDSFGTLDSAQWFDVLPELLNELRK